jgi:general secretion pathway protein L
MARTYIGVDIDQSRLHVVCMEQGAKELSVREIASQEIEGIDQAAEAVAQIVQDWGLSTMRMAAALPPNHILSRAVTFPFSDPRKIAAAVPLELTAQLPIDLDSYVTTSFPAGRDGDLYRSFALAVPRAEVEQFLSPFDRHQLPLRVLDIAPFSDLLLLPTETPDAILVTIRAGSYSVARTAAGEIQSYCQSLLSDQVSEEELASKIAREVRVLTAQSQEPSLPVYLAGSGVSASRQRALINQIPGASIPEVTFGTGRLPVEYLPALALARRSSLSDRKSGCNLRQGRYAFRGSLAPFRRQLIALALLLVLTLVATTTGFWFNYSRKAGELERLDQTLKTIYKQSFPNSPLPVDVPLFMASNLAGLNEESRLLGAGQTGPLQALEALTAAVGVDTGIDVKEFVFDGEGVSLLGQAGNFDTVDQLAARLRQNPIFGEVKISDAKMNVDGSRVDFRIDSKFISAGGNS